MLVSAPPILLAFLFSGPWAALLTAAGAVSIPIVIHLLNRNRYRLVPWAAMRFLLAAQKRKRRRLRIEQIILLAARTAIALLLVAAMASVMPWTESLWQRLFPGGATASGPIARRTHKILVIDGSFSMAAKAGDGTAFDRARAAAAEIVRDSSGGDAFGVVLMSAPPRRVVSEPSEDAIKVADEIQALHLPHGNADLAATLNTAYDMLRPEKSPDKFQEREVYFITDLQRSTWLGRQGIDPRLALEKLKSRARAIFLDVGHDGVANVAITDLTLGAPLATAGTLSSFTATLHNYGSEPRKQLSAELWAGRAPAGPGDPPLEMRSAGQKVIDVAAGQNETVTFQHRFSAPGDYAVQVRIDHDALDLDDVRSAVVSVKENVPVLLVNGKPDTDPYRQATEWLRDALNPFAAGDAPSDVPARPKVISDSEFHDAGLGDLTPYDCVFLCDVKLLTAAEIRRLETHVRRGGGLIVSLGPDVDLETYNRLAFHSGDGLLPARLVGVEQAAEGRPFILYADEESSDKPPLKAFTGNDRVSLLSARFRKYVRLELAPRGRARRILSFMPEAVSTDKMPSADTVPSNDPAMVEWARNRGRVVLLASSLNMDWTSWPLSPSFPAMMQELFQYAIAGRLREQASAVGDALEEYLPPGQGELDVTVRTPDGRTEATRTQERDDAALLRWTDTDASGIYRAQIGVHPREHLFAVNVPTATESQQASESDLARASAEELRAGYPGWSFQIVRDPRDVTHHGATAAEIQRAAAQGAGAMAARWLLLAVLAIVLMEVLLAWRFGHYSAGALGTIPSRSGRMLPMLVAVALALVLIGVGGALAYAAWTGDVGSLLPDQFRRAVENQLGIPPPAPGEGTRWRLEFSPYLWSPAADPWLAALLGIAALVYVTGIYLREGRTASTAYKILLSGLRGGFLLLTLAVLLPQLKLWFERQAWPDVAIIIDDSRSMSTADHYQEPRVREALQRLTGIAADMPRLQIAQSLLAGQQTDWLQQMLARQKVKLHVYHCSGRATRLEDGDLVDAEDSTRLSAARVCVRGLRPEGDSSQLGTAVRQVLNDFRGSSLAAIVMFTDGITTEGDDLLKVSRHAAHSGVPLFFVGLGDAKETKDLKLHDLQVEDSVYVNDRVIFEARLTGQGYSDLTVPVALREKGKSEVLATQTIKVDPQGKPVKFRLIHRPREAGEKTYVLDVPVQPDQVHPAVNNKLERTVLVRETKLIKVLYVEGANRWEFQKIKTLLERESARDPRNKTIDLKVLLLSADDDWARQDKSAVADFPTRAELNQFDIVIFGDVDPRDPRIEKHLQDVADFVRERGGGFLMIAGNNFSPWAYRDTPVADVLPIEIVRSQPADMERTEGFQLQLTSVGRFHPIFRFSPDEAENTAIWNRLREMYWWSEGYRAKWGAEVLAVHPTRAAAEPARPGNEEAGPQSEKRHPLMVQQFVGSGRSMFYGVEETWLWGYREDLLRFNQFWIQTVRYLARSRLGRVSLILDRQTPYRRGEPIRLTVRFPDDAPPPPADIPIKAKLVRTLPQPDGQLETDEETLHLAKVEGSRATYESLITRTPVGEYRFQLTSPRVDGTPPGAECRVVAPPGEMDRLRMNQQDMERAAEETQGRFYTVADAERLLGDLPTGTRVSLSGAQPPQLLWNRPAVLVLALGLLGAEWFLRKRKHLL